MLCSPRNGNPCTQGPTQPRLALHMGGEKYYKFDNGKKFFVGRGDLVYLPKGSSYVVEVVRSGDVYAINFDLFETTNFSPFVMKVKNLSAFLENFKQAENAWRIKTNGFEMKCKTELYEIISTALRLLLTRLPR